LFTFEKISHILPGSLYAFASRTASTGNECGFQALVCGDTGTGTARTALVHLPSFTNPESILFLDD
jgi:hypothetical protein